ncbi:MAG: hypothetical protein KJ060_15705 [Candidatus Hydrogenedentes bacterium]|nr:hypothetical protein [Candidatus Hydrogenedentota bacterium]
MASQPEIVIEYDVAEDERVVDIRGNWQSFAEANGAPALSVDAVVGHPLLSFFEGSDVREMYRMILHRIRERGKPFSLQFKCDDRDHERLFRLVVSKPDERTVRFSSTLLQEQTRTPVRLFDGSVPRSEEFLSVCSVCKQVDCDGEWLPVEEAVAKLHLMERDVLPQLSHGLCPACFERTMRELDESA